MEGGGEVLESLSKARRIDWSKWGQPEEVMSWMEVMRPSGRMVNWILAGFL